MMTTAGVPSASISSMVIVEVPLSCAEANHDLGRKPSVRLDRSG